jgi:GNAT superfamily N-acetyltransferase
MEVREIEPEEYGEAGEVLVLAYSDFVDPAQPGWDEHLDLVRDIAGRIDRTVVLAAVEDGRVLGSATIELDDVIGDDDPELPPGVAFLRMVGVHPDARRRGVGRALVQEVVSRARRAGKRTVGLRTTPQMAPAHRLYESLGFVRDPSLDLPLGDDGSLLGYRLEL